MITTDKRPPDSTLTPLVVEFLLRVYARGDQFPDGKPDVLVRAIDDLLSDGIIAVAPEVTRDSPYTLKDRGYAWVKMLLSTPWPRLVYLDPRTDTVVE